MKNILLIQTDQMRFDCLGANGNPYVKTPNLDRLAGEGANFTRHIVANPICMPSRASFFTGLYPPAHNVWNNGVPLNRLKYMPHDSGFYADKSLNGQTHRALVEPATMAEIFQENGYQTCMFGKLHLTPHSAPAEYAFEESEAFWESEQSAGFDGPYYGFEKVEFAISHGDRPVFKGGTYSQYMKAEHPDLYDRCLRNAGGKKGPIPQVPDLYASDVPERYHTSAWVADRFIDYCDRVRDQGKPFFAYIGFPDPHHPFTPSYDVVENFENSEVQKWYCEHERIAKNSPFAQYLYDTEAGANQVTDLTDEEKKKIVQYTYAMIYQVDVAVGRILDYLENNGMSENTVVVFTSDHGDFLCDNDLLRKSFIPAPQLLHVPFIIRDPRNEVFRGKIDTPMSNCDVLPTLLGAAGIEYARASFHGRDIAEVIHAGEENFPLAYVYNFKEPTLHSYTICDRQYRLSWYPVIGVYELYDSLNDPNESENLYDELKDEAFVTRLQDILKQKIPLHTNPILAKPCGW